MALEFTEVVDDLLQLIPRLVTQEPVEPPCGTNIGIRDPFGNHLRIVKFAQVPAGRA